MLHGAKMHLAEPRLYWRVKVADGKWKYVNAHFVFIEQTGGGMMAMISLPAPPSTLSEGDESEE
jgi:hypothetical protein